MDPLQKLRGLALSETGFLFDPTTGHTFSLNRTGTFLLRQLIQEAALDELPQRLTAEFDVDLETARRDVEQFIHQIRDLGFIATPVQGRDGRTKRPADPEAQP